MESESGSVEETVTIPTKIHPPKNKLQHSPNLEEPREATRVPESSNSFTSIPIQNRLPQSLRVKMVDDLKGRKNRRGQRKKQ